MSKLSNLGRLMVDGLTKFADDLEASQTKPLVAADLLKDTHPVHQAFNDWCVERSTEPTRRQATKFLQSFPAYRNVKVG